MLQRCGEKGTLLHRWWECKLIQPLLRTVWRFLKKLKIELPYDPVIPLLGIYPEKTIIQKESCITMFITKFLDKFMGKQTMVHSYSGILLSNKMKWAIKPWKEPESYDPDIQMFFPLLYSWDLFYTRQSGSFTTS